MCPICGKRIPYRHFHVCGVDFKGNYVSMVSECHTFFPKLWINFLAFDREKYHSVIKLGYYGF